MASDAKQIKGLLTEDNCPLTLVIKKEAVGQNYEVQTKPFARGKFAQVRRCVHKETNKSYAAKTIKKRRRANDVSHEIMHEIRVLLTSNQSERIVKLYEVYETPTEFVLMLEMAEGGELQRVLDEDDSIAEHHCRRLVRQIVEGVQHLHRFNIAHLDIKPQNILLTSPFPSGDVKLCDFGISRILTKGAELREIVGTPDYVAPEILQYEPISLATDMWSIGILTYVLLSGHSPFTGDNKQETYCNITNGPLDFPSYLFGCVSEEAKDFIRNLLVRDPKGRFNCQDCLKHIWLSSESNGPISNTINVNSIIINGKESKNGEESDSDKENQSKRSLITANGYHPNGSFDDSTNGFKHKRLSSDTFPDRKVVAVVSNESHKSDESPANNSDNHNKSLHLSDNESSAIASKCRKSPPTPSKKFFLSVDSSHTRSRSLSLDRKTSASTTTSTSNESVEQSVVMQFESMSFSRTSRSYVLSEEISVEERIGFVY